MNSAPRKKLNGFQNLNHPKPDLTLGDWYRSAALRLTSSFSEPISSVHALICRRLNISKAEIFSHPERVLTKTELEYLDNALNRLFEGEPLAYITNRQSFYGKNFYVNDSVLIPRPETEVLVNEAIKWLRTKKDSLRGLDVGTGSACIPISLCCQHDEIIFDAVDISLNALEIAKKNIRFYHLKNRINLYQANLATCFKQKYNLITANLPYIPTERMENIPVSGYEPILALDGGLNGEMLIRKFLINSKSMVFQPGLILCEIDYTQDNSLRSLARDLYPNANVSIIDDLARLPRILRIQTHV